MIGLDCHQASPNVLAGVSDSFMFKISINCEFSVYASCI